MGRAEDSLDDQVDAFILKYEQDSILGESPKNDMMSESLENLSLLALMNEQDEPDEGDDAGVEDLADDPAPDAEAPADTDVSPAPGDPPPAGSENMKPETNPVADIPKPPLDIDAFSKRIARLAMNYNTLLDVKRTIVNRASNFLAEHYDDAHVEELRSILDKEYDFGLSPRDNEPKDNYAVGAWAGGTGGLGGGG